MSYAFIREHVADFPIQVMCAVLGVSRSGYYAWASRLESARAVEDRAVAAEIRAFKRVVERGFVAHRATESINIFFGDVDRVGDRPRLPRSRLIDQAVQTAGRKPPAPRRHRDTRDPKPLRDRQIGHAVRREQHDLRPHRIRPSDLPPPCPRPQFRPLGVARGWR